jgi:serpin B
MRPQPLLSSRLAAALAAIAPFLFPFAVHGEESEESEMPRFETAWCKAARAETRDYESVRARLAVPVNDFGARLWRSVLARSAKELPANALLSPYSIHAALSMALAGAGGKTASELTAALGIPGTADAKWHDLQRGLLVDVLCPNEWTSTEVNIANGIFVQRGKPLVPAFVATLERAYDSKALEVDFKTDPEAARAAINGWAEKQTAGRIRDLLGPNTVDKTMRLSLANAVFIKAGWKKVFSAKLTKPGPFHLSATRTAEVPMMRVFGSAMDFTYGELPAVKAKVASLPTADEEYDVLVLLPDQIDGLDALTAKLDGKLLADAAASLQSRRVNVTFPKFKAETALMLRDALVALGMKTAFTNAALEGGADFTGIDGGADLLYIADVAHKATVAVDETGFEAAAATAVMMRAGSAPPKPTEPVEFVCDRPFLYVIRHRATGIALFLGRVTAP